MMGDRIPLTDQGGEMKKTTTVHAGDKKQGMTVPELVAALRGAKTGVTATAVIGISGRIKSITLTEMQEQK